MPDDTKPCVICGKPLECALPDNDWSTYQAYGGGEIRLFFAWGSFKFDLNMHGTQFRGLICDECGEKLVPKMDAVENR